MSEVPSLSVKLFRCVSSKYSVLLHRRAEQPEPQHAHIGRYEAALSLLLVPILSPLAVLSKAEIEDLHSTFWAVWRLRAERGSVVFQSFPRARLKAKCAENLPICSPLSIATTHWIWNSALHTYIANQQLGICSACHTPTRMVSKTRRDLN